MPPWSPSHYCQWRWLIYVKGPPSAKWPDNDSSVSHGWLVHGVRLCNIPWFPYLAVASRFIFLEQYSWLLCYLVALSLPAEKIRSRPYLVNMLGLRIHIPLGSSGHILHDCRNQSFGQRQEFWLTLLLQKLRLHSCPVQWEGLFAGLWDRNVQEKK